jgi:uncharacterized membrane protein YcaP (DUF421 family)
LSSRTEGAPMWEMSLPWSEFLVRAALVYLLLMVMVRISGKRTVGQFTPFDLLVVMLMSEGVSNALNGGDTSVAGGLLVAASLVGLNLLMGFISSRGRAAEKLIDGEPVLIARDGVVFEEVLRRHRLCLGDWEKALREHDAEAGQVRCAFLETDGSISVMKRA